MSERADRQRRVAEALANRRIEERRRRALDHLLVAALRGAVALAQRHHAAAAVAEDLHLDVPGLLDELLQEDAALLEVVPGQPVDRGEGARHFLRRPDELHADAAAAGGALQHHRIADALGLPQRLGRVGEEPAAGQERHAVRLRQRPGRMLEAEGPHLGRRRPDEDDPRGRAGFGEGRVFA